MAKCKRCGAQIGEFDKFCKECGTALIGNENNRQQEYAGKIYKCPNCGENVESFAAFCPSCGFELRDVKASDTIRELARKLEAIDAQTESNGNKFKNRKGSNHNSITEKDKQKVSLIRNYPIPNTREDLYEFLIMASSNVDMNYADEGDDARSEGEKALSNAWKAKYEQAYQKASLIFGGTKEFQELNKTYSNKIRQHEKKKLRANVGFGIVMTIFVGAVILAWVFIIKDFSESKKVVDKENERLELILDEIHDCIGDKDYDKAIALNMKLVFNVSENVASADESKKHWDEVRKEIYSVIDKATGNKNESNDVYSNLEDSSSEQSVTDISKNKSVIEKGKVYTYGKDEFNLYVATAITDEIIKIENWSKSMSTSKEVKYDYDVGTYKINDVDNGFRWINDECLAFEFNLTDEKESFFKKTEQVVFSVSNSEGDTNKGSFLKPDSVCYSYILDDWNTYKATFINDYTLKIECWYRHSTFRSLHYSYDVSVVDIRKIDNDFEWTDDDHNSFTVTLKDSENRDVKKGKFVTFEIDK